MMIIDKDSVTATKQKLDTGKIPQVIKDVKKMLEIKETLLWRSEAMTPCCGSLCSITAHLAREVSLLENTLVALEKGDKTQAADLLEEYAHALEASCEPIQPNYC
jgi:hypothetical protein